MEAYAVKRYQITGGPKWLDSDRFDVVAKIDDGGEKLPQGREGQLLIRAATQALLAERFQLLIHEDTRPTPGYRLVTAKTGFRLSPVEPSGSSTTMARGRITAKGGVSIERFAAVLASQMDRPVVLTVDRAEKPNEN